MRGVSGAFFTIFTIVYVGVVLNLSLALTCAPVWILATLFPLRNSWLWLALSAILLAPALAGAYEVFRAWQLDESTSVIKTYFTAWARSWPRVWLPGLGLVAYCLVIGLDLYVMGRWGIGTAALPVAAVLVALGLATACVAWIGFAARPDLTRWTIVKGSVYLAVRQPGRSLLTLIALGVLAAAIWVQPIIGLGLVAAPVLYVVWRNSRHVFAQYLPAGETPAPRPDRTTLPRQKR